MGLLDDLKKQADAVKAQDTDKTESLRTQAVAVDHSLRRLFLYLNDLGKQLNVVQMPSPFVFDLPTVGKVDGLVIKDFFCDFRSKHFIDKDYYGEVHVAYRCWSEKILTIKKGPDDMEKFRDLLWQSNIEHKSERVPQRAQGDHARGVQGRVRLPRAGPRSRATTRTASSRSAPRTWAASTWTCSTSSRRR